VTVATKKRTKRKRKKTGRRTSVRTAKAREMVGTMLALGYGYQVAADAARISLSALKQWREEDEDFEAELAERRAGAKRFYAMKLMEQARQGNLTAVIFWLKTRTEEFREKQFLEVSDRPPDEAYL